MPEAIRIVVRQLECVKLTVPRTEHSGEVWNVPAIFQISKIWLFW